MKVVCGCKDNYVLVRGLLFKSYMELILKTVDCYGCECTTSLSEDVIGNCYFMENDD